MEIASLLAQALRQRRFKRRGLLADFDASDPPIAGDVFTAPNVQGLLYVTLSPIRADSDTQEEHNKESGSLIEVGFVGSSEESHCLDAFAKLIAEALTYRNKTVELKSHELHNHDFLKLKDDNEVSVAALSQDDLALAARLEEEGIREVAIGIRRSGGVLAKDLSQKVAKNRKKAQKSVTELVQANLVSREHVVICKKTSNQINRVGSLEAIQNMADLGVRCSCGRSVSDERIEELYSPTSALNQMLDQSHWMSARLVSTLQSLGIATERVLLNLRDGPEEVDAFVDVDGALFMFELKDSTFSMGHAYAFSSRIAVYKPDYAVIVATKGVAPEVKKHFEVTEPAANLVYVDQLNKLRTTLRQTIDKLQYQKALNILTTFEPMAAFNISLAKTMGRKVGIPGELLTEL